MKQLNFKVERPIYRLSNGRFASKETADFEKTKIENKRLKLEVEKYRRMYISVVKEYERLRKMIYGY
jgi:cell shape-determining protein MreC